VAGRAVRFGVLGGALTLVLAYSGIGYFAGAVPFPFEPRGDVTAGSLCGVMGSLGDRERIAEELRNTLPTSREYSSSGDDPIRDVDGGWQREGCRVYGDGDQLFFTDAELAGGTADPAVARAWLDDISRSYDGEDGKQERFRAGSAAVMTQRWALILVPCTPRSRGLRLDYIEVEVYLHHLLVGSAEENRHALVTVALGTARSAHERAGCPLSANLPSSS
jgi:hypothetical protein